jgi:hypothetical protein
VPRKSSPVFARKIEYHCDCGKGVYRLKVTTPYTSDCRHTWLHTCTGCQKNTEFTVPYPLIEVNSGVKTRIFMMVDSKPVPVVAKQDFRTGDKDP